MSDNFEIFLLEALDYTLHPSNENFKKAEEMLKQGRQNKNFFNYLISILDRKDQSTEIKLASICCFTKDMKLFFSDKSNLADQNLLHEIFNVFITNFLKYLTEYFDIIPIRNKIEESLKYLIKLIFPFLFSDSLISMINILENSGNLKEIYSCVTTCLFIFSKYKNLNEDERKPIYQLSEQILPFIESLSSKLLEKLKDSENIDSNSFQIVILILNNILKIFKTINHLKINTGIYIYYQ